jgi:hypothetical protein
LCLVVLAGLCIGQGKAPGGGRTKGANGSGRATASPDPNAPKGVYPTSHGVLKSVSGTQLLLEVDDEHEMKFRITRKTKIFASQGKQDKPDTKEIKASSLHPGQTVAIDMQISLDGSYEAVRVMVETPN